jgi:ribosomal protein S18 acetylase RimI-like enzyme
VNAFAVHPANDADVPIILELIRELAEFEQLAHEVEVTADSLRHALFGADAVARALVARMNGGEPAGYAVFYRTFSTFVGRPGIFLDDLYVRPACRQLGIGRALLTEVARLGMELGGGRFEWITLRWNENAFRFYRSIGASVMNEWALLRMSVKEVRNLVSAKAKVAA